MKKSKEFSFSEVNSPRVARIRAQKHVESIAFDDKTDILFLIEKESVSTNNICYELACYNLRTLKCLQLTKLSVKDNLWEEVALKFYPQNKLLLMQPKSLRFQSYTYYLQFSQSIKPPIITLSQKGKHYELEKLAFYPFVVTSLIFLENKSMLAATAQSKCLITAKIGPGKLVDPFQMKIDGLIKILCYVEDKDTLILATETGLSFLGLKRKVLKKYEYKLVHQVIYNRHKGLLFIYGDEISLFQFTTQGCQYLCQLRCKEQGEGQKAPNSIGETKSGSFAYTYLQYFATLSKIFSNIVQPLSAELIHEGGIHVKVWNFCCGDILWLRRCLLVLCKDQKRIGVYRQ